MNKEEFSKGLEDNIELYENKEFERQDLFAKVEGTAILNIFVLILKYVKEGHGSIEEGDIIPPKDK